MADFSIIVCTYNPDERIFSRTLKAVSHLEIKSGTTADCIIVDNNSSEAITSLSYVTDFLKRCSWARVVHEPRQGKSYALIAGLRASLSDRIIVFDDDCEPASNYLTVCADYFERYPQVAIWGAGIVDVEYLQPVSQRFRRDFDAAYLAKSCRFVEYGCFFAPWINFYPPGLGQALRRFVLDKYERDITSGILTITGKKGPRSVSVHEDLQIILEAVRMGYAVGLTPDLKINHIIPEYRTKLNYLMRQNYGYESLRLKALLEVVPELKSIIGDQYCSLLKVIYKFTLIVGRQLFRLNWRLMIYQAAGYLGSVMGVRKLIKSYKPASTLVKDQTRATD